MKAGEWITMGLAEFEAECKDLTVVEVDLEAPTLITYVAVETPERMGFRGKYRAIWVMDVTRDYYAALWLPKPMNRFEMDMYVADS